MDILKIAKEAGVSSATVSRVINEKGNVRKETKEKVLEVIGRYGYIPNATGRSLSKKENDIIGVIVPEISNPYFSSIVDGIMDIVDGDRKNVILFNTRESHEKQSKAIKTAMEQRVRGVIISITSDSYEKVEDDLKRLKEMDIPFVLVDRRVKSGSYDGVYGDDIEGAYKGTKELIKRYGTDVGIITGPLTTQPGRDRLTGYKKAMEGSGVEVSPDNIYYGDFTLKSGYESGKNILLSENPPRSILISNNQMALGFIKYLNTKKIDRDINIMVFDKSEILDIFPMDILRVYTDSKELGEKAGRLLIDRINENNRKKLKRKEVIIKPTFNYSKEEL